LCNAFFSTKFCLFYTYHKNIFFHKTTLWAHKVSRLRAKTFIRIF
jgi:hypothetical protein